MNRFTEIKITWHDGHVSRESKEEFLSQRGALVWFTGLPASGKSSIAFRLEEALLERSHLAVVLDGDNIRHGLNQDLGFSPRDRRENLRRIAETCKLFVNNGIITLAAFVSPYESDRNMVREIVADENFIEVHVHCPLDVLEERDTKGLYKQARAGVIKDFTGISAPYEEPENPDLIIDTSRVSQRDAVELVLEHLSDKGIING